MKYYAVRQGRQVGIFTDWNECKRLVTGYKGAEYKGFTSRDDAVAFLEGAVPPSNESVEPSADTVVAYVDGSYNVKTKVFACGVVLLLDGGEEKRMNERFENVELATMRNVAGEIKGSMMAIQYCLEHEISKLHLFYDYEGIEKWCTGAWKTNKTGTIAYKQFYDMAKAQVDIVFHKVKGHSGDQYNDLADRLAKDAAGIE